MMLSAELLITGVTGLMPGIIALCLRQCICILLSMSFANQRDGLKSNNDNDHLSPAQQNAHSNLSILPALAFSLDMFEKTNQSYGVNEVLLASVLGAVVFALLAAQPLVIVGVTGVLSPESSAQKLDLIVYRTHYCVQLYSLRYHQPSWNPLPRIHVLDWNVRFYAFDALVRLTNL